MIYECPQCRTPQKAGQTVCPHCRAEFEGPVPADALVPSAVTSSAVVPSAVVSDEAISAVPDALLAPEPLPSEDSPAADAAPPSEDVPAEAPDAVSAGSEPYLTPPSYVPPPYAPPLSTASQALSQPPPTPPVGRLTRALLVAFPLVLILVLGGVYLAGTLNTEAESVLAPVPAVTAPSPPPFAGSAPVMLGSGSNTNDGTDPHVKLLAGRWVSKSDDFYVFNPDGTGSRGSALNPSADQSFLWGLVQNRLMLYGSKNETLRFNAGPDNDTVFLGPQTGHYVQYSRAKTST